MLPIADLEISQRSHRIRFADAVLSEVYGGSRSCQLAHGALVGCFSVSDVTLGPCLQACLPTGEGLSLVFLDHKMLHALDQGSREL